MVQFETFTKIQVIYTDMPTFRVVVDNHHIGERSHTWNFDNKTDALFKYWKEVRNQAAIAFNEAAANVKTIEASNTRLSG